MTLNKLLPVLAALRSYAESENGPHHFRDDIHYVMKDSRWHLAHPEAPHALIEHLHGAARGEHKLHVFGYEDQTHDGSPMGENMTREESATTADLWGVSNRAELLKRLTAGLPGVEDQHMTVSDPADGADYDDHDSYLDNLKYNDPLEDESEYEVDDYGSSGGVYKRTRSVPLDQDPEYDEDGDEIEQETEYADEVHYYNATTGDWQDDKVYNVLRPTSSVQIKHPSIGSLTRDIVTDSSGDKVGYQHYWEAASTGEGLSGLIYQSNFEAYEAAGCDKVTVHANITVGGYAWARHGFDCDSESSYGDLDGFKDTLKGNIEQLHSDHGTGEGNRVLQLPLDEVWDTHMGGLAPHEVPDLETHIQGHRVGSRAAEPLHAYARHAAEGRMSDEQIGQHVLQDLEARGFLQDRGDSEDARESIDDAVSSRNDEIQTAQSGHKMDQIRHLRTTREHQDALAHLAKYPAPEDHHAEIRDQNGVPPLTHEHEDTVSKLMGRHGVTSNDMDYLAMQPPVQRATSLDRKFPDHTGPEFDALDADLKNRRISDSLNKATEKHETAIVRSDPAHVAPDPGEFVGPAKITGHERDAAIRAHEVDFPPSVDDENPFTDLALEDLTDQVDAISYMHELAAFKLPPEIAAVTTGESPLVGKKVLKGSSWHGEYPLGTGMSNPQARAGNMYRAAKLLERATADHSGGTTVQRPGAPSAPAVNTSPPQTSAQQQAILTSAYSRNQPAVATDATVDFRQLARETRERMQAGFNQGQPNPWGDLGIETPMTATSLQGQTHSAIRAAIVTRHPDATPVQLDEAVNQWRRHVIGLNPSPEATWNAFTTQPPTMFQSPASVRTMSEAMIPELDDGGHAHIQSAWTQQLQTGLNRLRPADVVLGREILRASSPTALDELRDRNGQPFISSSVHPAVNTVNGQRAIGAAWMDERANHLLEGRRTPEEYEYEDAFGLSNMQRGPAVPGALTPEQLDAGLARALEAGSPVATSYPDLFKEWVARHHTRRLARRN